MRATKFQGLVHYRTVSHYVKFVLVLDKKKVKGMLEFSKTTLLLLHKTKISNSSLQGHNSVFFKY